MQPGKKQAVLYVFFGLIASGKSTLAEQFASRYAFPYMNTDRVRKELAGIDSHHRQPEGFSQGIYTAAFSRRTYQEMLDRAAAEIDAGCLGVVLDGSYNSRDERARVLTLAAKIGVRAVFIQCICSESVVRERLERRARDPLAVSDGRWEIYLVQKERFQPPDEMDSVSLITMDTEQPVAQLLEKLATSLNLR